MSHTRRCDGLSPVGCHLWPWGSWCCYCVDY
jgi:hypothetical protein